MDKTNATHKTKLVTNEFEGFSIEVVKNKKEISATNEIFYRYTVVYIDKRDNDVAYLVGNSPTKKEMEIKLKEIQARYPKAKIVRYSRGNVIAEN